MNNQINSIGFIGLGRMGFPMATHLANKHKQLNVYNRSFDKTELWINQFKSTDININGYKNLEEFAKNSLVNLVGGCCGTTPQHIASIYKAVSKYPPRVWGNYANE